MLLVRNPFILLLILLWSCNSSDNRKGTPEDSAYQISAAQVDSSREQMDELKMRLQGLNKRHAENAFVWSGLEQRVDVELGSDQRAIDDYVEQLEQLFADYRYRIAQLESELAQSRNQTGHHQKVSGKWYINWLESQADIERLIGHLENLEALICKKEMQIDQLHSELNRVYFAFGTVEELARNGVVDTRKSIWGKTVAVDLRNDLNTDYFATADKRYLTEIPVLSQRAELLSRHPENSFQFRGDGWVEAIEIIDPERFWKQTDYLAIEVE